MMPFKILGDDAVTVRSEIPLISAMNPDIEHSLLTLEPREAVIS